MRGPARSRRGCVRTGNTQVHDSMCSTSRPALGLRLCGQDLAQQGCPPLPEQPALLAQRDPLAHRPPRPEVLPLFLEGGAEPGCGRDAPEAAHGVVALLEASMILFDAVVE